MKLRKQLKEMLGLGSIHNYCPVCGSKNISAIYIIPINYNPKVHREQKYSHCVDCKYQADLGSFIFENIQAWRNKRIDLILNGI